MSKNIYSFYVFKVFFNATLFFTFCCLVYVAYTINITGIITLHYIKSKTNSEINKAIYINMNIFIDLYVIN